MAVRSIVGFSCLANTLVTTAYHCKLGSESFVNLLTPALKPGSCRVAHGINHSKAVRHGGRCCATPDTFDQNEVLKDAAKGGNLKVVVELLQGKLVNIDLPSTSRAGWTALHLACFYGHGAIVQTLLNAGANIEVRNDSGNTPLQLACLKGNIDIARTLLDSGADIHAESLDKGTAFDYAQEWGGDEMVDFLTLWVASRAS
ncbi:hypothetical protein Mapa_001921 [Marchantia paleacea]|nr:hypothetical protein Mapa_001921 [Marchantia paleacea]